MKRSIGVILSLCLAGFALAQAPFTIVRPADGSKVREQVKVLIPGDSIPDTGYIGVFVGGKFVEALVPTKKDKFYEYILDTKARKIPDGELRIEVVLYVDFNDAPRIVERSSVDVSVQNSANIPIPEDGISLRYKFNAGTQMIYNMTQRVAVSTITQTQNQLGGRAAEFPMEAETIRLLYAVDNAYGNGDGLVRMQAMPNKGKDYAMLTTLDAEEPRKFFDYEMHPIYMRLSSQGKEIFGSVPFYVPMEGSAGESSRMDLFASYPLPVLPEKKVKPGDLLPGGRFQWGKLSPDAIHEQTSVVQNFPARGQFVGVEWEMGYPCAKITHTIEAGSRSIEGVRLAQQGRDFTDEKVAMSESIWFALDTGKVVKIVRDIVVDRKVEAQPGGDQGGAQGGAPGGAPGSPNAAGASGPGGRRGGGGGIQGDDFLQRGGGLPGADLQQRGGRQGGGGAPGVDGGPQGIDTPGARGGPSGRTGGGAGAPQYVRLKIQQVFVLEK